VWWRASGPGPGARQSAAAKSPVTAGRRSRTRRSGADMDRTPKRGPAAVPAAPPASPAATRDLPSRSRRVLREHSYASTLCPGCHAFAATFGRAGPRLPRARAVGAARPVSGEALRVPDLPWAFWARQAVMEEGSEVTGTIAPLDDVSRWARGDLLVIVLLVLGAILLTRLADWLRG